MCLAVPAKIVKIEGTIAEVDMAGTSLRASLVMVPDAKLGDYVLLHTGFAISVIDEHEALETLKLFKELEAITEAQ